MDSCNTKIVVFYCSTNIERADLESAEDSFGHDELTFIELPCSGKVDVPYLMKAFEGGADGVLLVTCKKDECQYMHGSFRADNRVRTVNQLLEEIGLGVGRMVSSSLDDGGIPGVVQQIQQFRDHVKALSLPTGDACAARKTT